MPCLWLKSSALILRASQKRIYQQLGLQVVGCFASSKLPLFCSKDAAFNYLDGNSSEAFAAVSWHTGLMILRVDACTAFRLY